MLGMGALAMGHTVLLKKRHAVSFPSVLSVTKIPFQSSKSLFLSSSMHRKFCGRRESTYGIRAEGAAGPTASLAGNVRAAPAGYKTAEEDANVRNLVLEDVKEFLLKELPKSYSDGVRPHP
jgi:hypothetical protein